MLGIHNPSLVDNDIGEPLNDKVMTRCVTQCVHVTSSVSYCVKPLVTCSVDS